MPHHSISFEKMVEMAKQLSPLEKIRLIERVVPDLEQYLQSTGKPRALTSAYGRLTDLGTAPSANDIDETRQEIFSEFPREDI